MSEIFTDSFASVVSSIGCDRFGNKEKGGGRRLAPLAL